jgi:hypothetical protein
LTVVHLIFEGQFEAEVITLLHREIRVPRYQRLDGIADARAIERQGRSAYHVEQRNSMIIITCDDDAAAKIMAGLAALRDRLGEGIRGYATRVEQAV